MASQSTCNRGSATGISPESGNCAASLLTWWIKTAGTTGSAKLSANGTAALGWPTRATSS